ncbi:hypothetical protein [Zoogloea sp.]|uniref:hypothetical protein n=1 Tax=Zoogloea sp. TaxID=49181 RepID=UPI0035B121B4
MSATPRSGGLRVCARWQEGELDAWQVQLVRPPVGRALVGLSPELALARIPLYYSLCAHAQQEAGRLALLAAGCAHGTPPEAWRLWGECLHEQLWRLLLDWPAQWGDEPLRAPFVRWRASLGERASLKAATRALLTELLPDGPESGFVARGLALLQAEGAAPAVGAGLVARARGVFEQLDALEQDQPYPLGMDGSPGEACGAAWVHTARGALRHHVQLAQGRVVEWRVDAPTDRNFADEAGIVKRLPVWLPSPARARQAVERAVLLLDPCVPFTVEVVNA